MNTITNTLIRSMALALLSLLMTACGEKQADEVRHVEEEGPVQANTEFAKDPGPNGGRLVTTTDPSVEFLLRHDQHAQLTFVDESGSVVPAAQQVASLITGDRMDPTTVEFRKEGDVLVSESPLPKIEGQPVILAVTASTDAEPVVERFNLKTHVCSGCNLQEYACICGH